MSEEWRRKTETTTTTRRRDKWLYCRRRYMYRKRLKEGVRKRTRVSCEEGEETTKRTGKRKNRKLRRRPLLRRLWRSRRVRSVVSLGEV